MKKNLWFVALGALAVAGGNILYQMYLKNQAGA
jgi:hypothetical protein